MFKIGDTVDISKTVDGHLDHNGKRIGWRGILNDQGKNVPFVVTDIKQCDAKQGCNHKICPGYVNGECFGYTEGYVIDKINDWDGENNE